LNPDRFLGAKKLVIMNRTTIYLIAAFLMVMLASAAQAQDSTRISLQTAIENAIKNRNEIKIQKINAAYSQNEIKKSGSKLLPQLTGDVDERYNGKLQTNLIPGDAFGALGAPGRYVQFGTKFTTTAAFSLTVPIYNPGDFGDRKIAQVQADYDALNVNKSETDMVVEVTQSYFNVLLDREKEALSKGNLSNTESIYTMSKDQLIKGAITSYNLEKNRINFENAKSDHQKNQNNTKLALLDMAYRMGVDSIGNIVMTDNLTSIYQQFSNTLTNDQNQIMNRVDIRQQLLQEKIYQENINKQNKSYLPTVSLYGNYTGQNLSNNFSLNGGNWYPYNYVGVKVSVPIFDGFQKQRTKHGYELQLESARLTTEKLKKDYTHEALTARTTLLNDQQDMNNQQNNLRSATDLYKIDMDRLQKGAIKPTDLTTTYYTLQQTQTNYLNAVYTYLLDVIQFKKAMGNLPATINGK
jgi:outer membrane protein